MSEYCRLCAKSFPLVRLKDKTQLQLEKLDKIILKLFKIDLKEPDILTKSVCTVCCLTTLGLERFVSNVERAQKQLQEIRCLLHTEKIEVKTLDEEYLQKDKEQFLQDELLKESGSVDGVQSNTSRECVWECYHCYTFYPTVNDLHEHFDVSHHITVEYTCSECRVIIFELTEFRRHMTEEHDLTQYNEVKKNEFCTIQVKSEIHEEYVVKEERGDFDDESETRSDDLPSDSSDTRSQQKNESSQVLTSSNNRGFKYSWECCHCNTFYPTANALSTHFDAFHQKTVEYTCSQCGAVIVDLTDFRRHMNDEHDVTQYDEAHRGRFQCDNCDYSTNYSTNLKQHQVTHTGIRNYSCDLCDKKFFAKQKLLLHLLSHGNEDQDHRKVRKNIKKDRDFIPFFCFYCKPRLRLNSESELGSHFMKAHFVETIKFCCLQCLAPFEDKKGYLDHYKSHTKLYHCDFCGKEFNNLTNFKTHRYIHTGEKKFECDSCDSKFYTKQHLNSHRLTHFKPLFKCEICSKICANDSLLQKHQRSHMALEEKLIHECDVCQKRFMSLNGLLAHKKTHDETSISVESEYICEKCAKTFRSKGSYIAHYKYCHPNDTTPCACEICGKELKNAWTLKKHMKYAHVMERRFVCDTCGSKFREPGSLRRHRMIHTGELPHQCEVCKKRFRVPYALKIHSRQHTGERPYSCTDCNMFFSNDANYKKHIRVRHGKISAGKNSTDFS